MTAAEVQTLVDGIPCDLCNSPPGQAWYLVAAALIDLANGDPVPTTTQDLVTEANCLMCMVTPGMLPYLMIQALRGISSGGGGGGGVTSGSGAPVAAPSSSPAIYIDEDTGTIYSYYGGAWH